jgi:peptidyl-tRNA hydrolase
LIYLTISRRNNKERDLLYSFIQKHYSKTKEKIIVRRGHKNITDMIKDAHKKGAKNIIIAGMQNDRSISVRRLLLVGDGDYLWKTDIPQKAI